MKKFVIIALAAAMSLAACSKTDMGKGSGEVSFQVASYATKLGIEGTVFPTSESFGVYAWAEGTVQDYFMPNERISYGSDGLWKPAGTYYWPKGVTIDFFGYYPYGMNGLSVSPNVISYADYDVEAKQEDVMYASKSVGYGDNPDGTGVGIDGTSGVPIVFHHALAKVLVDARLAFNHRTEEDGTTYDWTITVNDCTVSNFQKKGGARFELAAEPTEGLVDWVKPEDANGYKVWTGDGTTTSKTSGITPVELKNDEPVNILPEFFVLPQAVGKEAQWVSVNFTVKTSRNGEPFLTETMTRGAYLYIDEVPAWEINHIIRYLLVLSPIDLEPGGTPSIITFDPAVSDWEVITVSTPIVL